MPGIAGGGSLPVVPDVPPEPSARSERAGLPVAALVGLVLATLALRPQLVGIGPLIPAIQEDLDVSHAVAGLLGTIPVFLMGVFAPLGPRLAGHVGPRIAVALCLAAVVVFGVARALVPDAAAVILTTFGIGLGMGTAGALLPIVVKLRAAHVPALATGLYAAGIVGGAFVAAAVAVPLSLVLGGWRPTLLVFAMAGLVSLAAWLVLVPADPPEARATGAPPRLPWGSRTAWVLAAVFGVQSVLYYSTVSWLSAIYVERGWDEASAGSLVAVVHLLGLGVTIVLPWVADRVGTRRSQLMSVAVATLLGFLGLTILPDLAWAWVVLLGFGLGAVFPLVLTLPVDVSDSAAEVGATAALMLLGGYIIASVAPVGLGMLRDATGDYSLSLWLLVLLGGVLVASCAALSPARLRRGVGRTVVSRAEG